MATAAAVVPEVYARDAMIAWFRGEFAAANAIIDALCSHLAQIGGAAEYEPVFAAVHRRRLNWIPVLHMQKYYSIAEVAAELRVVAANREAASFASAAEDPTEAKQLVATPEEDKPVESGGAQAEEEHPASEESAVDGVGMAVEEEAAAEEEPAAAEAEADDGVQVAVVEEAAADEVSSDHKGTEEGDAKGGNDRPHRSQIRVTPHWSNLLSSSSGYIAVFEVDQTALMDHSLFAVRFQRRSPRPAPGRRRQSRKCLIHALELTFLSGIMERGLYKTGMYSTEWEESVRQQRSTSQAAKIEMAAAYSKQLLSEPMLAPHSCTPLSSVSFGSPAFTRELLEEYSKLRNILSSMMFEERSIVPRKQKASILILLPYFKPPHLDTPISTLLLSDTTMAFGRSLVSDHEGNYKGPLTLSINQGSLLVMRGNSADMARHVVCASPNRRIIITFVKVRAASHPADSPTALQQPSKTMALWQPAQKVATAGIIACGPHAMIPAAWGLALRSPVVMLPPPRAMVMSPNKKAPRGGTGVFLPWTVGPKKYTRHLPPRIQKRRLPSLPSPLEVQA
ncbi:hypothetical protein BHM03_00037081 [Ensete ventricosum]|nr:hypothetical protein BHM03_00037081 [Ensete ventricosum]